LCRRDSRIPPIEMQRFPCSPMTAGARSTEFRGTSIARTEVPHLEEGFQTETCFPECAPTSEKSWLTVTSSLPCDSTPFEIVEYSPCSKSTSDQNSRTSLI
jgi:hypothetical protein